MGFGKGTRGMHVAELQKKLNTWIVETNKKEGSDYTGCIGLIADGVFGDNTVVAISSYQKLAMDIDQPSGFADDQTIQSLGCQYIPAQGDTGDGVICADDEKKSDESTASE